MFNLLCYYVNIRAQEIFIGDQEVCRKNATRPGYTVMVKLCLDPGYVENNDMGWMMIHTHFFDWYRYNRFILH